MTTEAPQSVRAVDDPPVAPCSLDPASWDLDASTVEVLTASVRVCRFECPLLTACRSALAAGAVRPASMVLAGMAFDYNGDRFDLDSPRTRTGPRNERDTRGVDAHGRRYNGHTGRWESFTRSPAAVRRSA
ncbi:hypothetical protein CH306_26425 [Rhodococcus sp. 15-725-2-2b]|uniref:hypothetical protein n=1 Tax=unclassified Rhodococcus (in: high G+C Gram-positive bacteria) TaxID=192944 RepID=UPI000B9A282F|nr:MULTISPECIES: hypothetical protein [unclassified Rhodococcus (in: high G+C Gram-positive bacteria)]OZC63580.1 hypothetical protein CH277_22235 [Rhodococcus sp. 06-469-3-2]OZD40745.1 hypothetical protein CH264_23920 [Rhodococcus sp. 06-1477-1A]OZE67147.1 hypothetical protein CH306_26425 [Rhodococcus sp. 15-725-2-2b]